MPGSRDKSLGSLYLVDGSAYIYRAFHAIPALTSSRGLPTNAVYGFTTMLLKLLREERPEYIAVVFDAPGETFRDRLFAEYKSNRPPLPDDLRPQLPYVRRVVDALGLAVIEVPGVEADDVIGTLTAQAAAAGVDTVVVTADKDLMQVVGPSTVLYDSMRGHRFGVAEVVEKLGVAPEKVPDVLALMGDPTDNIPGVAGIGEKTASALVARFGSVERLFANLDAVETSGLRGARRIRKLLEAGAESARLSKRLATVRRDLPLELDLDALRTPEPGLERLRPICVELEFHSLLRELTPPGKPLEVTLSEGPVPAALAALGSGPVALSVQLGGPRPTTAPLEALAIAGAEGPVVLVREPELRAAAGLLGSEAVAKLGDELKPVVVSLGRRGIAVRGLSFDAGLASYLLDPGGGRHGVAELAEDWLGARISAAKGEGGELCVCRGARAVHALRPLLEERLRAEGMERLYYDLELPLVEVLAAMELAGVKLDVAALAALARTVEGKLAGLMDEIYRLAGCEFNINSPAQLRDVLFNRLGISTRGVKRGKTGLSTDVDVLTRLAREHPLPARILAYRGLAKLKNTYIDALPALCDPATGRIHTTFNQTVTATGRLSSSDPNLQNIPVRSEEGRQIRAAFVAEPGWRLVSADYSQIELRVLAHLSGDAGLLGAFAEGEDIHARTAAEVMPGLPQGEARRLAKVINYGILYGMGPQRLAREAEIAVSEAEAYIERYFSRYPGVRAYIDRTVAEARQVGYVTTLLGRRRYLPELRSGDSAVRQLAERTAINTPVQGSAADLIKLAMLATHRRIAASGSRARLLLQVHDELVLECPAEEVEATQEVVRSAMEGVAELRVPLAVDVSSGATWAEAH